MTASVAGGTNVRPLPILAVTTTAVLWGFSYVATKGLLEVFSPLQVAALRFLVASAVLGLLGAATRSLRPLARGDWFRAGLAGSAAIPIYFFFENNGLRLTTAGSASLIMAASPVLNMLAAWIFLKDRLTPAKGLGAVLSFVGVYMIISLGGSSDSGGGQGSLTGDLLILGAAASTVVYTLVNRPLIARYDPIQLNVLETWIGTLALLPFGLTGLRAARLSVSVLPSLLYLGVLCSAFAYLFFLVALRALGTVSTTCFINLVPVFGLLGGYLFLGERLVWTQLLSGVLIVAGVTISVLDDRQGKQPEAARYAVPSHGTAENRKAISP